MPCVTVPCTQASTGAARRMQAAQVRAAMCARERSRFLEAPSRRRPAANEQASEKAGLPARFAAPLKLWPLRRAADQSGGNKPEDLSAPMLPTRVSAGPRAWQRDPTTHLLAGASAANNDHDVALARAAWRRSARLADDQAAVRLPANEQPSAIIEGRTADRRYVRQWHAHDDCPDRQRHAIPPWSCRPFACERSIPSLRYDGRSAHRCQPKPEEQTRASLTFEA